MNVLTAPATEECFLSKPRQLVLRTDCVDAAELSGIPLAAPRKSLRDLVRERQESLRVADQTSAQKTVKTLILTATPPKEEIIVAPEPRPRWPLRTDLKARRAPRILKPILAHSERGPSALFARS
jgi:hypothetical protein